MKIGGQKFKLVEITDSTIARIEKLLGITLDDFPMYPTQVCVALVSISTGLSPKQSKELIERHMAKHGPESINDLLDGVTRAVNRAVRRGLRGR